jgi:hypothetical protein
LIALVEKLLKAQAEEIAKLEKEHSTKSKPNVLTLTVVEAQIKTGIQEAGVAHFDETGCESMPT